MTLSISADARSAMLQASFQQLATASGTLNAASDNFSDAAQTLDEALNKLNPGVTAWIVITNFRQEHNPHEIRQERLGFAKINNKWGLGLCRVTMEDDTGEEETTDQWLFNDAPRNLRLEAIQHVPELVEALAREAEQMAKRVSEGAEFAKKLAISISALSLRKGNR
jgi:hypothetical protein